MNTLKAMLLAKRGQVTAGTIMIVFITLLIGLALFGPILDFVAGVNTTDATVQTLVDLVPIFYVLLILAVAALPVVVAFRKAA